MKRILPILLFIHLGCFHVSAQDIPLFSQKLTNSFIYNPSMAGHTFGSATYSFRQNYSNVPGAPRSHLLSAHAPFANYRMGAGINIFQEEVNFIRNTYVSIAGAYHIHFDRFNILSLGLSGEYNLTRLSGTSNTTTISPDPVYYQLQNGDPTYDFSFGVNYQSRFWKAGFALNRMATSWLKKETSNLTNYYSAYVQGLIPVRNGEDLLEPYVALRNFSETNDTYDIGIYYTYDAKLMGGVAVRKGNVYNVSIGYKFLKRFMVGYAREMIGSSIGGYVGSANEFTLRYDFNDETYKDRFQTDYKTSKDIRKRTDFQNKRQMKKTQKGLEAPKKKFNFRKAKPVEE